MLLKKKKSKKREYGCEGYQNLSKDEKRLVEYRKRQYEMQKNNCKITQQGFSF